MAMEMGTFTTIMATMGSVTNIIGSKAVQESKTVKIFWVVMKMKMKLISLALK